MKPASCFPLSSAMRRFFTLPTAVALLLATPLQLLAVVDDSHSMAMEAAVDAVKAGFKIRQEYWSGILKSGEQKMVKQQLFKGNEYWFFLGTDEDKIALKVEVLDRKGAKIQVETQLKPNAAAVRVRAPATGTYYIVFSLNGKENEKIPWALAYGYR